VTLLPWQITEATWHSARSAAQRRADDEARAAEEAAQKAALVRDFPSLQPAAPAQPPKGAAPGLRVLVSGLWV
jgi:hypothetical protein